MTSHEGDKGRQRETHGDAQAETSVELEPEPQAPSDVERRERKLDEAIEMTFPASDPLAI